MMTFMRLLYCTDDFVCYEYGKDEKNMIGKVTVEIKQKQNCKFEYYGNNAFTSSTGHTVGMIYKFINNNKFPVTYIYAC